MPIDSELPPAPARPGWETAQRLEIRWTIPMGGKPVVSANYQIPLDVFNRIASQRGYLAEQRNRLRSVLVGDVPQQIPESWRSNQIRQWFVERMAYYTPAQIQATVATMVYERLQLDRREREHAEQLERDRAELAEGTARLAAARLERERRDAAIVAAREAQIVAAREAAQAAERVELGEISAYARDQLVAAAQPSATMTAAEIAAELDSPF